VIDAVTLILSHLPHIIPAILGVAFLGRFALYIKRLPPAHLNDEELAEWHAQKARKASGSDAAEQPLPR
jgi:hypothetical protein